MSTDFPVLFEEAFAWLREHYNGFCFYTERDVVWTVQNHLIYRISMAGVLGYSIFIDVGDAKLA